MSEHKLAILTPTDAQIKRLYDKLEAHLRVKAKYSISGLSDTLETPSDLLSQFFKAGGSALSSVSINGSGITITFYPRVIVNNQGYQQSHPYFALITTTLVDSSKPSDEHIAKVQLIISAFASKEALLAGQMIAGDQNEIAPQREMLNAIQRSAADQIARTDDFFTSLVERFEKRQQELEDSYLEKLSSVDKQKQENDAVLGKDRDALIAERKELDDRTNTHARRAIRGELITTLQGRQNSFSVSKDTKQLRWPIHLVFMLLLFGSASGAAWSLYVWGINPTETYGPVTVFGAVKSVIFTFTFITTAGLYVSWMNRWFDKHADAQFQTKQFEIDINRASWAVEAALEWKGAQGEQMPDALLLGITKHLFEAGPVDHTEYSPLEALASSILGAASNLKLDINGNKIDLDRKSLKEIKKQSDS